MIREPFSAREGHFLKRTQTGGGAAIEQKMVNEGRESWIATRRDASVSSGEVGIRRIAIVELVPDRVARQRKPSVPIPENDETVRNPCRPIDPVFKHANLPFQDSAGFRSAARGAARFQMDAKQAQMPTAADAKPDFDARPQIGITELQCGQVMHTEAKAAPKREAYCLPDERAPRRVAPASSARRSPAPLHNQEISAAIKNPLCRCDILDLLEGDDVGVERINFATERRIVSVRPRPTSLAVSLCKKLQVPRGDRENPPRPGGRNPLGQCRTGREEPC